MPYKDPEKRKESARRGYQRRKDYYAAYRQRNKEKLVKRATEWNKANPEKHKASLEKFLVNNKGKKRYTVMKSAYGISMDGYNALFSLQQGRCAICNTHQDELNKNLSVDHCHDTGKIRGLLCQHCNSLLGFAKDSVEIMNKAVSYLTLMNDL